MRESAIEKAVVTFAKEQGIGTYKLSGPNDRGKPDRIFFKDGKVLFMELKATGQEPTALQYKTLDEIRATGTSATWANTIPMAKSQLYIIFNL